MSHLKARRLRRTEFGISLIELMITMLISSFLVIGITQLYVDNQRNYIFQQSQSGNQENTRFAEFVFNEYLSKAGYRRAPDESMEEAFPQAAASADCKAFDLGESVTAATDGLGVCIRYQPLTSSELDCQGNQVNAFADDDMFQPSPQSSLVVLVIRYQADAGGALDAGKLQCKSINSGAAAYVDLLQGIADFRIDVGVGKPGEKTLKENSDAGRFKAVADWAVSDGPIRAVRYSILMASRDNQRDIDESAVLDGWLRDASDDAKARLNNGDNRRIYQIAHSTQSLRNLTP